MNSTEILIQEYNNLWNEKLVHKQGIRKFHNYLTYITAIGSLALAFHGVSTQDFFNSALDPEKANYLIKNASNIVHLFFIPFAPIILITLTFPLNDLFHIFAIGNQIAAIENKINTIAGKELLVWEHSVCPKVYGGEKGPNSDKIKNIISAGDYMLLIPSLFILSIITTVISSIYICEKTGCLLSIGYMLIVVYMFGVIIWLASKITNYIKPDGLLTKVIKASNEFSINKKE